MNVCMSLNCYFHLVYLIYLIILHFFPIINDAEINTVIENSLCTSLAIFLG